jgi:dynactin complex subunit
MQNTLVGKLDLGTRVVITNEKLKGLKGTVKYIGPLEGMNAVPEWIGLELDDEKGSHSGQYQGKQYFQTKPKHGAFIKPSDLTLVDGTPLTELHSAPPEPSHPAKTEHKA